MFTRILSAACVVAPLAVVTPGVCLAGPVVFPVADGGTGHSYEVVFDPGASYAAAKSAAVAGGGQLVTITSADEQAFVESLLTSTGAVTGSYWLGLERAGMTFSWVGGETYSYHNFAAGEPNDYLSGEDYGAIYWSKVPDDDKDSRSGQWNDLPFVGYVNGDFAGRPTPDLGRAGYVIERIVTGGDDTPLPPNPNPIPLPPAVLAAPVAFLVAGIARRRRRIA